ncbi:murein hydrolase effector LrgB [Aerococcus urinaehominis]|uniref:Murein hydrolase effector LrgB n=1 Tax=Aerococcus urinaehominis TaxID=128944 RepID=A0A0X8FL37_9LACT|nr:LrgB family protein [Aerococcus urinaehominis]AMB99313.1 murein hydrolase effector LrgB [Aerococcus urinaehominis]SDM19911.1 TIGR00659 family protein [Aerococcus urinaehominis]
MMELFTSLPTYGLFLTLAVYFVGLWLSSKIKSPLAHPLLLAVVLIILVLLVTDMDVAAYQESASFITYLLTPATIALAIPVYKQVKVLKENFLAILVSCLVGMVGGILSILLIAVLFSMDTIILKSVLAKSVTTAIALGITEEIGGIVPIIVGSVILTGIFGVIVNDVIFKIFKVDSYFVRGLGMGAAAHAMGTAESVKRNELQGAMSSLAMVICGILIAVLVPITISLLGL